MTLMHGKVWINEQQYFDKAPLLAWELYIGGYQPAQKWLRDRKGREFSHYQKIIVALTETDRLMKEIDIVGVVVKDEIMVESNLIPTRQDHYWVNRKKG